MKHLAYSHQQNRSLAETMVSRIRAVLPRPLRSPNVPSGRGSLRPRLLVLLGWFLALAIQAALLVVVAELVELVHGVMALYLDLAEQQLELTSLYVAATGPDPAP